MNSDVSVIIPVYNGARFTERTIESVLRQTLAPKEIIIVDDASTDETRRCIERVAADHTFIQVPENRGVCHSRNAGIRASTSPLIALSDQDDLWHPEKLARQVAAFEAHPSIELLFTNFQYLRNEVFDESDKSAEAPPGFWQDAVERKEGDAAMLKRPALPYLLMFQPVFPSTMMFRRTLLDKASLFDEPVKREQSENLEFLLRCDLNCRMAALLTPLATIRKHGQNYSGNTARTILSRVRILTRMVQGQGPYEPFRAAITAQIRHRTLLAFNALFAEGDLAAARLVLRDVAHRSRDLRVVVKGAVVAMPGLLGKAAWRVLSSR